MQYYQRKSPLLVSCLLLAAGSLASANLISGVSATATSQLFTGSFDRQAIHTVDGSGLTGNTHVTGSEGNFWETVGIGTSFGTDRAPAITFNLNGLYSLDSMEIWNFSESASAVSLVDVETSLNGTNFTSIGQQTLATSVNPGQVFSLGGNSARYVQFDILENGAGTSFPFTTGTPSGSGFAGLGEVQFSGSAILPEPAPISYLFLGAMGLLIRRRR